MVWIPDPISCLKQLSVHLLLISTMCEGRKERVLINFSDLGFMAASAEGGGARVSEKSRGISLKSNDLER